MNMLPLHDPKWKELHGGYRMPYDASVPLRRLEEAASPSEIGQMLQELWSELHHQGDVDLASYYSVAHLIRIAQEKRFFDANLFGLIATIEIARHAANPPLPPEYRDAYLKQLTEGVPALVKLGLQNDWDSVTTAAVLSAIAAVKGHTEMAEVISRLDDPQITSAVLDEY